MELIVERGNLEMSFLVETLVKYTSPTSHSSQTMKITQRQTLALPHSNPDLNISGIPIFSNITILRPYCLSLILHWFFSNIVQVRSKQLDTLNVVLLVQLLIDRMCCIC
jgi:hypothetical protein